MKTTSDLLAAELAEFVKSDTDRMQIYVQDRILTLRYDYDEGQYQVLDEDLEVIAWNDSAKDFLEAAPFICQVLASV